MTASLVALDGRKRNFLEAAILSASPVCGLRPMRAARLATTKVPSVVRTGSFFDVLVTVSKNASTTLFTSFRARPLFFWTAASKSRWFMVGPLLIGVLIGVRANRPQRFQANQSGGRQQSIERGKSRKFHACGDSVRTLFPCDSLILERQIFTGALRSDSQIV